MGNCKMFFRFRNPRSEVTFELLLCITEHTCVTLIHRNIKKIVQIGENGHMTEFCHARNKHKAEQLRFAFDHRIETFQSIHKLLRIRRQNIFQNRLVVFIQQNNNAPLLRKTQDQFLKHRFRRLVLQFNFVNKRLFFQNLAQTALQILQCVKAAPVHVKMNNRMLLPAVWLVVKGKPFEQLLFPFKNSFQSGESQRFSETARTGKKIHAAGGTEQIPEVFRFIYI